MKHIQPISTFCKLTLAILLTTITFAAGAQAAPNILFITMDDMNWDSAGCYGSTVEDISPHIDSLAGRGMRFQHAYIQSPICTPSRNVLQTGRYPHVSGVQGFYGVKFPHKTVSEHLRYAGYYAGIVQKLPDSTPSNKYEKYWDVHTSLEKEVYRNPAAYGAAFREIVDEAIAEDKPFYAVINVVDPHRPFYRSPKIEQGEWDRTPPSREYGPDEVPVPGFLPQGSAFAQEMADYYCTVKRGDDCVGAVLDQLRDSGLEKETIIVLLSDHGMPLPFAKAHLYPDGVRTPWIVVWPGMAEPGYIDTEHMISAIDFMPSVLEMAGIKVPGNLEGRSIIPLIKGEQQENRDRVFVELNENPNADVRPTRGIYTRDFVYIFNPWSNGERIMTMECRWYRSWGTMNELSKTDPFARERFDFLKHRTVEELYHYTTDPYALNNLIDNPHYRDVADRLRKELEEQMVRTGDYVLPAFRSRDDPAALEAFIEVEHAEALERAEDTEWKRWKNCLGPTEGHSKLYDPDR